MQVVAGPVVDGLGCLDATHVEDHRECSDYLTRVVKNALGNPEGGKGGRILALEHRQAHAEIAREQGLTFVFQMDLDLGWQKIAGGAASHLCLIVTEPIE